MSCCMSRSYGLFRPWLLFGGIPDSFGNRSVCLTGISKEESHAGKMEKTVVFEDGMKVVNVLFILLYLVRNPLFTICAYTVWLLFYLVYSVRHTK